MPWLKTIGAADAALATRDPRTLIVPAKSMVVPGSMVKVVSFGTVTVPETLYGPFFAFHTVSPESVSQKISVAACTVVGQNMTMQTIMHPHQKSLSLFLTPPSCWPKINER
jgi:hypothetical protein